MLNLVAEYFNATTAVAFAFSTAAPSARRAVESSSRGYVVKGLRLHYEELRKDEEVSCHLHPTRTVCIHDDTLPPSFYYALWWLERDGDEVPVAFRATRLTGSLHYGVMGMPTEAAAAAGLNVLSTQHSGIAAFVRRTVSLFLGGSRLREVHLNPAAVTKLERLDVSNCHCLKSLQFSEDNGANAVSSPLRRLRILKASFSGLVSLPAPTLAAWAPALTTVLLSGCHALSQEQVNGMLDECSELRVARLDSTRLSSINSLAATCPYVTELNASNCGDLHDVSALAALSCLRVLDLHNNTGLTSLEGVGQCCYLRRLDISHCKHLSTLLPLEGSLLNLEHFNASYCPGLRDTDLHVLRVCALLEEVKVNQCPLLHDFSALSNHANLLVLEAADTNLATVEFLHTCAALERLSVTGCTQLKDLDALCGLPCLTTVDANYTGVTRVAKLVDSCAALRVVLVQKCELDTESTDRLEACATHIASTHRTVNSNNCNGNTSATVTATA